MRNAFLTLGLIFSIVSSFAQTPSLLWQYSFSDNVIVNQQTNDDYGNVIICGSFRGTADLDFTSSNLILNSASNGFNNTDDAFICKYSSSGQLLWHVVLSSSIDETINDMTVDALGDIYINSSGVGLMVDLDPGAGVYYLPTQGPFIAKYSAAGQLQWANRLDIGRVFSNERMSNQMAIHYTSQDLIIAGSFTDTIDIDPSIGVFELAGSSPTDETFFVARFDGLGQLVLAQDFDGVNSGNVVLGHDLTLEQLRTDQNGNTFLVGKVNGTIDIDPSLGTSMITNSGYFAKLNTVLGLTNVKTLNAVITSIDIDMQQNVLIGGRFANVIDFDPGAGTALLDGSPSTQDFFIGKYNSNLDYVWAFTHNNTPYSFSGIISLNVDTNDNVIVYGYYDMGQGSADFDPGLGTQIVAQGNGMFLAKYSPASDLLGFGSILNYSTFNGSLMHYNKATNKLELIGGFQGNYDFDLSAGVFNVNHPIGNEFIARYDLQCESTPTYLSDTICYGDTITIATTNLYATGIHPFIFQSLGGCDSVVLFNLIVRNQNITNINETICSTQMYYFNNVYLNVSGFYSDTLISANGCDSIVNLNLTIVPLSDNVSLSGYILASDEVAANSYQWYNCTNASIINGATGVSCSISQTANYAVILSKGGCIDTTSCILVNATSLSNPAPNNLWGNQYNTLNPSFYKVDKQGNSYLIGEYLPAIDLDPDTTEFAAPYDIQGIYIIKYKTDGSFEWAKWMEINDYLFLMDVEVDTTGSIIIAGGYNGSLNLDPSLSNYTITSTGLTDIFIFKYDSSGLFAWANTFGGAGENYPTNIALDKNNNICVVGYFEDDIDFDTGIGTNVISTQGGMVFNFITKYDAAGNYISGIGIDNLLSIDKVVIDNENNIYYAGMFADLTDIAPGLIDLFVDDMSTGIQNNSFIVKLDQNYNFLSGVGLVSDQLLQISDLATDVSGNLVVTGYYRSSVNNFNTNGTSYPLTYQNNDDVFMARYDQTLNLDWIHAIGNVESDYSTTIKTDGLNNIYLLGKFGNLLDIDATPGMMLFNSSGISDNYVTSYDSIGNFNWAIQIGSASNDEPVGLGLDGNGNIYVCGNSNDSISFNREINTNSQNFNILTGAFVAKYGPCNFLDTSIVVSTNYLSATAQNVSYQWYNCDNATPIVGATNQSYSPINAGQYSVLLGNGGCAQMSSCINFSLPVGISEQSEEELVIFPNPSQGIINFSIPKQMINKNSEVVILNTLGQVVKNQKIQNENFIVDISELSSGIFYAQLTLNSKRIIKKIIKE
jgi:hypothetical protein